MRCAWWWLALPLALYVCWLDIRMRELGASRSLRAPSRSLRAPSRAEPQVLVELLAEPRPKVRGVVFDVGALGQIRLFLRPEWTNASAEFAEAVAAAGPLGTSTVYRLEPGFLIQGRLAAAGARVGGAKPRAPKLMERGEVGWAGGSGGPDWFIYVGTGPATWLGNPHEGSVWAEVADEASLLVTAAHCLLPTVAEAVSALPVPPTTPGQMHTLSSPLPLAVRPWAPSDAEVAAAAAGGMKGASSIGTCGGAQASAAD
ncbi:hypothetical protein T492DRAFT_878225 [Pavlovales sp. CCMP2436]|nr:hypothetical protein T492DRAFT_878225 [Pavlovales sp. CCMP2436]